MIACVDRRKWTHKPTNEETRRYIQKQMTKPEDIGISELVGVLCNGGNCRPAAVNGTKKENFISSQLQFIDVDNGRKKDGVFIPVKKPISIEDAKARVEAAGFRVSAIYFSWSDPGEGAPYRKFRMILQMDEPITDRFEYTAGNTYLIHLLPPECADTGTTDPARIFYGSGCGEPYFLDETAVNSTRDLLLKSKDLVEREEPAQNPRKKCSRSKRPTSGNTINTALVDAIKKRDEAFLVDYLHAKKQTFDNKSDLIKYILCDFDLAAFLGVNEGENFSCILDGHLDVNPSANVFRTKYGYWRYVCMANCQHAGEKDKNAKTQFNTRQLFEELTGLKSQYQVLRFICKILNLEIKETEWAAEQKANIDEILEALTDGDENGFSTSCPIAEKNVRNALTVYTAMLIQARKSISPERNGHGDIIFYCSIRNIARATNKDPSQIKKYTKLLAYHRLIIPLKDEDVPKRMLERAIAAAPTDKHGKKMRHSEFYSVPSWVISHLRLINDQGKKWRDNGYRLRAVSYELFFRTEPEEARFLYPQSASIKQKDGKTIDRGTTYKADEQHDALAELIITAIDAKGYCTEREIIESTSSKALTERQILRSIADITASNRLVKVRCNKLLKEQYGIPGSGYPSIIVRM